MGGDISGAAAGGARGSGEKSSKSKSRGDDEEGGPLLGHGAGQGGDSGQGARLLDSNPLDDEDDEVSASWDPNLKPRSVRTHLQGFPWMT